MHAGLEPEELDTIASVRRREHAAGASKPVKPAESELEGENASLRPTRSKGMVLCAISVSIVMRRRRGLKAIHLICRQVKDGFGLLGLTLADRGAHRYRSCCWDITESDADALNNGWIYLHVAKSKGARFGGRIERVERLILEEKGHPNRIGFWFEARKEAVGQHWRGANYSMAWTSGLVEVDAAHELD